MAGTGVVNKIGLLVEKSQALNTATDDFRKLQIELQRLNNNNTQADLLQEVLDYETRLAALEEKIAEARKQQNAGLVDALEQQTLLIDAIHQKKMQAITDEREAEYQQQALAQQRLEIELLQAQGSTEKARALQEELDYKLKIAALDEQIAKTQDTSLISQLQKQKELQSLIYAEKGKETYTSQDVNALLNQLGQSLTSMLASGQIGGSTYATLQQKLPGLMQTVSKSPDKTYQLDLTVGTEKISTLTDTDPQKFLAALEKALRSTT